MDLSHWNLVDKFSIWEAACLAAGVDPGRNRLQIIGEEAARVDLILRELTKAWESARDLVIIEFTEEVIDPELDIDTLFSWPLSDIEPLPSVAMISEAARSIKYKKDFVWQKISEIEEQQFTRQKLGEWFSCKRFIPAYPFVASPNVVKSDNKLSAQAINNSHVSKKLSVLNQAATKFWSNADRNDRTTHPDNSAVIAWLIEHDYSQTLASSAATIIRPEWAPTGRKPEE